MSKCGLRVAAGGERDAKVFQKVVKRCPKTRPGAPRGRPFWHLGLQTRTFAKHRYLACKTNIFTPRGLLLNTCATHSDVPGALIAKRDTKVMQKVPRGTPRERPGWPPWRPGCQKVPKKVTENDHKLHHLATDCPKAVQGGPWEPFGVPPSWQNVLPAGWLAGWLAGWPAGCLAGWLGLPCLKPQKINF